MYHNLGWWIRSRANGGHHATSLVAQKVKHIPLNRGGGVTYLSRRGVGIVSNVFGTMEKMLRGPGSLLQGGIIIDQLSSIDIKEGT